MMVEKPPEEIIENKVEQDIDELVVRECEIDGNTYEVIAVLYTYLKYRISCIL